MTVEVAVTAQTPTAVTSALYGDDIFLRPDSRHSIEGVAEHLLDRVVTVDDRHVVDDLFIAEPIKWAMR